MQVCAVAWKEEVENTCYVKDSWINVLLRTVAFFAPCASSLSLAVPFSFYWKIIYQLVTATISPLSLPALCTVFLLLFSFFTPSSFSLPPPPLAISDVLFLLPFHTSVFWSLFYFAFCTLLIKLLFNSFLICIFNCLQDNLQASTWKHPCVCAQPHTELHKLEFHFQDSLPDNFSIWSKPLWVARLSTGFIQWEISSSNRGR